MERERKGQDLIVYRDSWQAEISPPTNFVCQNSKNIPKINKIIPINKLISKSGYSDNSFLRARNETQMPDFIKVVQELK